MFLALFFSMILIGILLSLTIIPAEAIGTSDTMTWKIIFVTSWEKCSNRNLDALTFYGYITEQYLTKYNIKHQFAVPACVSTDNMYSMIKDALSSYDLLIIIPDILQSIQEQKQTGTLGHYSWQGSERSIVSQAYSLHVEHEASGWILSHELSHFALEWKGYPHEIWGDGVHEVQSKFNECLTMDTTGAHCSNFWTTVKTPSGKDTRVMSPIYTEDNKQQPEPTYPEQTNDYDTFEPSVETKHVIPADEFSPSSFTPRINPIQEDADQSRLQNLQSRMFSNVHIFYELELGQNISYEAIAEASKTYDSPHAKEEVSKAWGIMDNVSKLIGQIKIDQERSEEFLKRAFQGVESYHPRKSNSDLAEDRIERVEWKSAQIGSDLTFITEKLDYAEKFQNQYDEEKRLKQKQEGEKFRFCFLWWCF